MKSTIILLVLAIVVPAVVVMVALAMQTPSVPTDVINSCVDTAQIVGNCLVK